MTRICIGGAAGRMGQKIIRLAGGLEDCRVVGAIERADHPDLGSDAGLLAGCGEIGVPLASDVSASLADADVFIDFTFHEAVPGNLTAAVNNSRGVVIGTTGLTDKEQAAVARAAKNIPVVQAPNMSTGVNLLFAVVEKAAEILGMKYSVEIDETHHVHKKDAPSGTALGLGRKVAAGRGQDLAKVMVHNPKDEKESEGNERILMLSHREGEVVGEHTVAFENEAEKISFSHSAKSRDAFALGSLRAAQWLAGREPGLYDMQDVLELRWK